MSSIVDKIRAEAEARLREIEQEREYLLQVLSASPSNGSNTQPRLADALQTVLDSDKPLQLKDIFAKLQKQGLRLKGQNPKMSVYSALKRHPNYFEKTPQGWIKVVKST